MHFNILAKWNDLGENTGQESLELTEKYISVMGNTTSVDTKQSKTLFNFTTISENRWLPSIHAQSFKIMKNYVTSFDHQNISG